MTPKCRHTAGFAAANSDAAEFPTCKACGVEVDPFANAAQKIKEDVQYGNVELDPDEFAPKHTDVRFSLWLNGVLLAKIRKAAKSADKAPADWIVQTLEERLGVAPKQKRRGFFDKAIICSDDGCKKPEKDR